MYNNTRIIAPYFRIFIQIMDFLRFLFFIFFVFSEFSKPIWLIFCFFNKISEYFLGFENPEKTKKNEKNVLCFKTIKRQSKSGTEKEKHKIILTA